MMNVEAVAKKMYEIHSEKLESVDAGNRKLPSADKFFDDPKKQKQADAWRAVAQYATTTLM